VNQAGRALRVGERELMLAGGVESMSRATAWRSTAAD
jgi:acetyl-CoA acetyltransferase